MMNQLISMETLTLPMQRNYISFSNAAIGYKENVQVMKSTQASQIIYTTYMYTTLLDSPNQVTIVRSLRENHA